MLCSADDKSIPKTSLQELLLLQESHGQVLHEVFTRLQ